VSADTDTPGYPKTSESFQARGKAAKSMLTMDDPDHAALRRLLTSSSTLKKIEAMRPGIQRIVDGQIDEMLAGPRHHLAFGYGVCQCLGQPLARLELQVAYSSLFRRIQTLALAKPMAELSFKRDMTVYGLHDLPVTWQT
jgi:cytochrome P450